MFPDIILKNQSPDIVKMHAQRLNTIYIRGSRGNYVTEYTQHRNLSRKHAMIYSKIIKIY